MAGVKYATLEFFKKVMEEVNKDEAIAKSRLTATIGYVYTDRKGVTGKPLTFIITFINGKITEVREGTPEEKVDIKFSGDYDIWVKLIKGELNPMKAIMEEKYIMEAPIERLSEYQGPLNRMVEIIKSIEAEY